MDNGRSESESNGATDAKENGVATAEKFGARENYRIIKNISILGFAFMIHFTAFHGTSNLQSSVHSDGSLGAFTLASIYGSLILSNIFLPVMVIRWLGCKWTIVVSFVAYMPYIAAQFFPRFYTLIPAGLAVGFGGGPLWCAKCTYLSVIAEAFSVIKKRKVKADYLIVKFFGLFFVFYQLAQVLGNLISFSVLSYGDGDTFHNATQNNINISETCGANYIAPVDRQQQQESSSVDFHKPDVAKLNILTGIFLACMAAASFSVAVGVDSLERYDKNRTGSGTGVSGIRMLIITAKQFTKKYQLLLLPITMFIGVEQAFIAVDFTASFVACGLGISYIGYAMISFGLANAVAAAVTPYITKVIGRFPMIIATALFHLALIVFMLLWKPTDQYYAYSIIVACWGLADGIWLIQINALSGILFPGNEEAAFSNFRLWEATGSVLMYATSPILSTFTKLVCIMCVMLIGTVGYTTIEVMEYRIKKGAAGKRFEMIQQAS
ncbi:UNC93-like protein [Toxorhynchites rutilus septentrionalis]|uniref:UNC93-like protein n=1 Tax=Toxorhynchites rutilus septentrionalis TaxID=329112 RepID=UPI002478E61A|nr:UNC93-like protein [Toxorhynchites rutilus septentrionalis]